MKPYYGLTGTKLNIAIACIAGTDFALFGYDQVGCTVHRYKASQLTVFHRVLWVVF